MYCWPAFERMASDVDRCLARPVGHLHRAAEEPLHGAGAPQQQTGGIEDQQVGDRVLVQASLRSVLDDFVEQMRRHERRRGQQRGMRNVVLLEPFLHAHRDHSGAEKMILVVRHPGATSARCALRGHRQPLVARGVRHAIQAIRLIEMPERAGDVAKARRIVAREDVSILESRAQDVVSLVHDLREGIELRLGTEVPARVVPCGHGRVVRRDLRIRGASCRRQHHCHGEAASAP